MLRFDCTWRLYPGGSILAEAYRHLVPQLTDEAQYRAVHKFCNEGENA